MKECFRHKDFRPETLQIIEACDKILCAYSADGYDLSLRQLYYQMIAHDLFPDSWADGSGTKNLPRNYNRLGSVVNDARLAGLLDWDSIVDRGRHTSRNSHWENPGEILDVAARSFRLDKWADQPVHVEVMCEKQALEGVLEPVCSELDVSFTSNKGYASQSFMYRKAKELIEHEKDGKRIELIYLGDHDPSGLDMDRDIEDRLHLFMGVHAFFEVTRIALTMDQIETYDPPPNPAKVTDSRCGAYIEEHGNESWELDALDPSALAGLVRGAVESVRDELLWQETCEREEEMRGDLIRMARRYQTEAGRD